MHFAFAEAAMDSSEKVRNESQKKRMEISN